MTLDLGPETPDIWLIEKVPEQIFHQFKKQKNKVDKMTTLAPRLLSTVSLVSKFSLAGIQVGKPKL